MADEPRNNDFKNMGRAALEAEARRLAVELDSANQAYANLTRTMREQADPGLELAETIFAHSPSVLFRRLADPPTRLVYVSANVSQWGYRAEDLLSGAMAYQDIVLPADMPRLREEIRKHAARDVEEYVQEYRIRTADGLERWVRDHTGVVRDASGRKIYNQGIVTDITEYKRYERELRRKEEKFRRIVETTSQGFLLMDPDLHITDANDSLCALLGLDREQLVGRKPLDWLSPDIKAYMVARREQMLAEDKRVFESEILRPDGRKIPVIVHSNALRDSSGRLLGQMAFVTDLSEQKRALRLAGEVQRRLLDVRPPRVTGLDVAGASEPCDEVGGDYMDYPPTGGPGFMAVVGDISGHGVDAALCMTAARALFRAHAQAGLPPSDILSAVNRQFTLDHYDSGRFMTLFVLKIEQDGALSWVRAGHDPGLAYDPETDTFAELMGLGMPLGVDPNFAYRESRLPPLPPGRIVALGSDGIWEAQSMEGSMYGKRRFKEIIRTNAHKSAQEIVRAVFDSLTEFSIGTRRRDDVTLMVVKRTGTDA